MTISKYFDDLTKSYPKTYSYYGKDPKPKWYQFRLRLSSWLVAVATKIYPENPEVWNFMMKQAVDCAIYGQSRTHVGYCDFYKDEK